MKNTRIFYLKTSSFFVVKFSIYLRRRVFVMVHCILCKKWHNCSGVARTELFLHTLRKILETIIHRITSKITAALTGKRSKIFHLRAAPTIKKQTFMPTSLYCKYFSYTQMYNVLIERCAC